MALGSVALASQDAFQTKCAEFANKINLPNGKVNFADYVPGGTNLSLPENAPSCDASYQAVPVDLCRVAMAVNTSDSSKATLEAWFPREYKGRFLSSGNGGLSGCMRSMLVGSRALWLIHHQVFNTKYDLAYTAHLGFVTVGTNNSHNGTSGKPFYHHPGVLKDFAYRSVHADVVVGKDLTKKFDDEGFSKSYYLACSTGGCQEWKSVQKYPDGFDGVVAGAPAVNFINLLSWSVHFYLITGSPSSDTYLTPAEWTVVHEEFLRKCDLCSWLW